MPHIDRVIVALIGTIYATMATQLSPPYILADLVDNAPALWEVVFLAAGASCLACAATGAVWLRFISGGLIMVAAGSRGIAVLGVAIFDPAVSFIPALGWTLIFILQAVAWPVVAPRR